MSKARGDPSTFRGQTGDRMAYRKATEKKADVGPGAGNIEFVRFLLFDYKNLEKLYTTKVLECFKSC